MGFHVVYVIGTYPRPTTTFIDREVLALRRKGVQVTLLSIRRPGRGLSSSQRALQADVRYVLPAPVLALTRSHLSFLVAGPRAYLGTLVHLLTRPHPDARARLRTVLHFGIGVRVARMIRDEYPADHIHAHFVDRAALVALVAGRLLGTPFSATAHANDIYVDPVLLPEKMTGAKFIATCTRYNERHLSAVAGVRRERPVRCVYHGVDVRDFHPSDGDRRPRPMLLAVGQLKEKKGFRYLLEACRILSDRGIEYDCEIVGDGPLRSELLSAVDALDLDARVSLIGSLPHEAVVRRYAEAAVFVLPCVTAPDGDRDGIPNVILEAMAMALPVVSTLHSGIPEAVDDGETGFLVPPADPDALADALARLLENPELRSRLGQAGRRSVVERFDLGVNVERLLEEFVA